jgi:hypothetical protein
MSRQMFLARFTTLLIAVPLCIAAQDRRPDFSGTWQLVKERSDFGRNPKPVDKTLISEKRDGYLHSVVTSQTPEGEQETESNWYLDGKPHHEDKPVPGYSITHWEGNTLVNERRSTDGHFRETTRLSLSSDGNEATEIVDSHTPSGDNHAKLIWKRK